MCRPELVWAAILAAGVAAEVHALAAGHHDCTLSAMTRRACHTQHPVGRVAFVLGSYALTAWFCHHITAWKDPTHG